jgi:hypothetical protein
MSERSEIEFHILDYINFNGLQGTKLETLIKNVMLGAATPTADSQFGLLAFFKKLASKPNPDGTVDMDALDRQLELNPGIKPSEEEVRAVLDELVKSGRVRRMGDAYYPPKS